MVLFRCNQLHKVLPLLLNQLISNYQSVNYYYVLCVLIVTLLIFYLFVTLHIPLSPFCVSLCNAVEWNNQTFSWRYAVTEALGSFPLLWQQFHWVGGCGLSARAAETQLQLWAWGDPLSDPAAAQEVLEGSCDWRHKRTTWDRRLWRQ